MEVNYERAVEQWQSYVATIQDDGWAIVEAPESEECPDGVFIEDAVVVYRGTALITNPGNDARKPEIVGLEQVFKLLGCNIAHIKAPGTLDGGDVLKVGDTIYVGQSGRTNEEGIQQLA